MAKDTIWQKKEPVLKMLAVFNGSGSITIENNPETFNTLPHGSPVQATSTPNVFTLIKGFEAYEAATTATDIKVKKNNFLGVGDAFAIAATEIVTAIDRSNADYDLVTFDTALTVVVDTVYSQVPTAGKASLTFGQAPINNDVATKQAFCAVLSEGLIDTDKLIIPAILDNTGLLKGITNNAIVFA